MRSVAVLSTAFLLAGSAGFAQEQAADAAAASSHTTYMPGQLGKPFQQLEKLYAKGKWEKLVERSNKVRRTKHPRAAEVDYLNAQAHFQLVELAPTSSKRDQHLGLALRAWSRAAGKDTKGFVEADQTFKAALASSIEHAAQAHFENGRVNRAKVLTNSLARYLNDTIPLYAVLSPAPKPVADMPTAQVLQVFDRSEEANTKFVVPALAPKRKDVLAFAHTFEGSPYKWGGESTTGFDCSGFVLHVFQHFGYDFYHNSREIARLGEVVPMNRMKPGDIACFGYQQSNGNPYVSHVGIVASASGPEPKVIHATNTGVHTDSIAEGSYWNDRLLFVRDVMTTDNTPNRSMYGPR